MKKTIQALVVIGLCGVFSVGTQASTIKVINKGDEKIYLYFKGKNGVEDGKYHIQAHSPHHTASYQVSKEDIGDSELFDVIASKTGTGNPDLKLLAGSCTDLRVEKNYTLVVEPGFKTSCKIVKKK